MSVRESTLITGAEMSLLNFKGFTMNVRAAAANVLFQVVDKGHSLSHALPAAQKTIRPRDHALLQEICYGALRYLPRLESIANELMENPLKVAISTNTYINPAE